MIREKKIEFKNSDNKNSESIATNNNGETQGKYPDGTGVIIGDSILSGIICERLSRKGRVGGTKVDDMKHRVIPLLRKEPSLVTIHAGTNDAPYLTWKILDNLLTLKSFITDKLPNSEVVFCTPTLRWESSVNSKSTYEPPSSARHY